DVAIIPGALPDGRATAPDGPAAAPDAAAIITRPGASSRQGEVESIRVELARLFPSIYEIQSDGTLDAGDVCEAGTHFFIGISERTNEDGARQLADIFTARGFTHDFVDIRTRGDEHASSLLHLKSGLAYLGGDTLVVSEALAARE